MLPFKCALGLKSEIEYFKGTLSQYFQISNDDQKYLNIERNVKHFAPLSNLKRDLNHLKKTSIPSQCFKVGLRLKGQPPACNSIECQHFDFSRYKDKFDQLKADTGGEKEKEESIEKLENIIKCIFEESMGVFETIERIVNRKEEYEQNLQLKDLKKQEYFKKFFDNYVTTLKMLSRAEEEINNF